MVRTAVRQLIKRDGDLLRIDVAERAITHRLANRLSELFGDWDVDCEYNRDRDTIKRLK